MSLAPVLKSQLTILFSLEIVGASICRIANGSHMLTLIHLETILVISSPQITQVILFSYFAGTQRRIHSFMITHVMVVGCTCVVEMYKNVATPIKTTTVSQENLNVFMMRRILRDSWLILLTLLDTTRLAILLAINQL